MLNTALGYSQAAFYISETIKDINCSLEWWVTPRAYTLRNKKEGYEEEGSCLEGRREEGGSDIG